MSENTLVLTTVVCIKCNTNLTGTSRFTWCNKNFCESCFDKWLLFDPSRIEERVARLEKEVARLTMPHFLMQMSEQRSLMVEK